MSRKLVCRTEDVPANGMKAFQAEGGLNVLIANSGDDYFAYQAICPHQDVPLEEGFYDGCVLTCHQHLWQWDIRSGAAIGLAEAPLAFYDIKVDDGSIYIVEPSALKMAELFADMADPTLDKLNALARTETFEEGATVYKPGDAAADFYILESGRINFAIGRGDRTSPAGFILRKGELFGWAALLENMPQRIATATCVEKSTVLCLDGKATLAILDADPKAGFLVMRRLSSLITRHLTESGAK